MQTNKQTNKQEKEQTSNIYYTLLGRQCVVQSVNP